jgi:predicted adenylyl cyclase CyaB
MARNVEIKARVSEEQLEYIERSASARAAGPVEVLEQSDTFYTVPSGRLKLRRFADGSAELIAYDRGDQSGPKLSSYVRHACADPDTLHEALARSVGVRARVDKTRRLLLVDQTRVHLDRVEGLGAFIELEVVLRDEQTVEEGERIARELMAAFEIPGEALVEPAYVDLLEASRGG